MTTIRKIVTSKIDGNNANSTDTNEVRPFGETAFYVDIDGPTNKLVLSIHDGERTHLKSKVLAPGVLYGSDADSGDGNNYDTIKLIPDATLHNNGSDQYLIVDPTAPNHIHIRAGGTIDNSNAALILGGENSNVEIQAGEDPPVYVRANNNTWMFDTDGSLTLPTGVTNNGRIINDNGISLKVDSSFWTFGTDGTTTFPNDSIITSNTELNIATSPTTTYTFSQAYWEALNGNNARIFTPTNNAQYFSCIVTAQQDGTYTVDITGAGNTFVPGNWFKVPGDELGGSAPANDIQITVATVGGGGEILTVTVTGTAVGKQWTFGTDGSLTIPGDITGNNDINITVDSGDSSSYTWNFGQTGDLSLPGGGLLGQVWGDGIDTELTLKSPPGVGDSGYVALSSANERNYVEVSNIGVVLGVEFGQAGFKKLTFGTDGNLKSADGEPLQILSTGAGGAVSLAWSSSLDSPENIALVIANSPGAQISGAVDIVVGAIAGPNIWTFDPSGALTIPGDIQSEEDISIRINLSDSTTRVWRFGEDGDLTFPDNSFIEDSIAFMLGARDSLIIRSDSAGVQNDWIFGADGTLTIPGDIHGAPVMSIGPTPSQVGRTVNITPADDASDKKFKFRIDQYGETFTRSYLELPTAEVDKQVAAVFPHTNNTAGYIFTQGTNTNDDGMNDAFNIFYNNGDIKITSMGSLGGLYTWKFGDTGNLTLPGDIRSEREINIDINLSDSTQRRWRFGEDGNLNLAGNLQFANGPEIRDVNGDLRLRAAPGEVVQLQGLDTSGFVDSAVKVFYDNGSFVTINTNIDAGSPEQIWTFDSNGDLTAPGGVSVAGILKIDDGVHEQFQTKADATGVVTHDCAQGHIIYHTSPDDYFTVNLTNLNLASGYATSITVVVEQGATGYGPNALQIGGVAQTINWQGGSLPASPTANGVDVLVFSILNNNGTYVVLAQVTGFNEVA